MTEENKEFSLIEEGTSWPSGDYIDLVEIPKSLQYVESLVGRKMLHGVEDGLGPWAAMGIKLKSGQIIEIIKYQESQASGLIVRVDRKSDLRLVLPEVLVLFGCDKSAVLWINPEAGA